MCYGLRGGPLQSGSRWEDHENPGGLGVAESCCEGNARTTEGVARTREGSLLHESQYVRECIAVGWGVKFWLRDNG